MSYLNPHRQTLAEDMARQHWEDHELLKTPMHTEEMAKRAEAEGITVAERHERMFQHWLCIKKGLNPKHPEDGPVRQNFAHFHVGTHRYD